MTRLRHQTLWHFSSQAVNAALGFASTVLLTRTLSVEDFGLTSFVLALVQLVSVFFDFGVSSATMRLAAVTQDAGEARVLHAASLQRAARNGGLFALAIVPVASLFALVAEHGLHTPVPDGTTLMLVGVVPILWSYLLLEPAIAALQGRNAIGTLALLLPVAKLLHLALYLACLAGGLVSARVAVLTTILGVGGAATLMWTRLRPDARGVDRGRELLRQEIRHFGREVYLGRIVDGVTNGLDKVVITLVSGVAAGGVYAVAFIMTMPLGMLSSALSASAYRRFATMSRIPRQVLWTNATWCLGGGVLLVAGCELIIPWIFPAKYGDALRVLPLLAGGAALAGLNQPFHAFLSAHRQGRAIKVMSITTSSLNIAANLTLIPFLGMHGAGIALVLSYGLNILMNLHYYHDWRTSASNDREH